MNQAKYEAAKRLNEQENKLNMINEQINNLEMTVAGLRAIQAVTKLKIYLMRQAVAAMQDGEV